jgi:hypothetical protein
MMSISIGAMLLAGLMIAGSAQGEPPSRSVGPAAAPTAVPSPSPGTTYGLPGVPNARALRARANLEALLQGRIFTSDLSPEALQDVLDFDRLARGGYSDNRSFKQRCIDDEVRRNGGQPTRLAWQVIRLKCQ